MLHNKFLRHLLYERYQLTLGRSVNNDIRLKSSLAISRQHVSFNFTNGKWGVTDLNSGNGTFVCNKRLQPRDPVYLEDRDIIEVGRNPENGNSGYKFVFYQKANVNQPKDVMVDLSNTVNNVSLQGQQQQGVKPKEKTSKVSRRGRHSLGTQLQHEKIRLKQEMEVELAHQIMQKEAELREQLSTEIAKVEKDKMMQQVEQEKIQIKEEMENILRTTVSIRESKVREELEEKILEVEMSKIQVEEELRQELDKLKDGRIEEKQRLEKVLAAKFMEHAKLLEDLDEVKQVVADEQSKYKTLQDTLVTSVEGVLDDELTCSICNEMFIKATTLTCSHSFCQYCIEKWISTRASSLCPLCKAKIESKVHALVLDNTISTLVLKLPAEKQAERQQAIDERKEEEKVARDAKEAARVEGRPLQAARPQPQPSRQSYYTDAYRRGQNNNNRQRTNHRSNSNSDNSGSADAPAASGTGRVNPFLQPPPAHNHHNYPYQSSSVAYWNQNPHYQQGGQQGGQQQRPNWFYSYTNMQ